MQVIGKDVIGDDVIGSDRRPSRLGSRPTRPPATLVGAAAALVLLAGIGATVVGEREPAPPVPGPAEPALVLQVVGRAAEGGAAGGGTADGGAGGELVVGIVNSTDTRVRLGALSLVSAGLQVVSVVPAFGRPLGPREGREYVVRYEVPVCAALQLPVSLRVTYDAPGTGRGSTRLELGARRELGTEQEPGPGGQAVPFAICPEGSTLQARPDLAVRAIGGGSRRDGAGARGTVELEVRNAGARLDLLSVGAEVPGVRFINAGQPNGVQMLADDRVEVNLAFEVDDCALLRRTGRLVLRVRQAGVEREIGLTITSDVEAATVRQLALDRVLQACG